MMRSMYRLQTRTGMKIRSGLTGEESDVRESERSVY